MGLRNDYRIIAFGNDIMFRSRERAVESQFP